MKTKQELQNETSTFQLIPVFGHKHVIMPFIREDTAYPEPDYLGTGMALIGVLRKGQTLDDFKEQWVKDKMHLYGINSQFVKQTYEEKKAKRIERGIE